MKKFLIFQAKEQKTDKSPTHNLIFVDDTKEGKDKYTYVGVGWAKSAKSGTKYLSCVLSDENEKYNRKGYKIVEENTIEEEVGQIEEDPFMNCV